MHIPAQFKQISVTRNQTRAVPALRQVPAPAVPEIIAHRKTRQHRLHESPQVGAGRFQDQVKVIVHQDIQINSDAVTLDALGHPIAQRPPVPVVTEYFLTSVSPHRHVVDRPCIFNS
jgi:hypothetical protein